MNWLARFFWRHRVSPPTITGRPPAYRTAEQLEAACARRKQGREARSAASSKGWSTRRADMGRDVPGELRS